MTPLATECSLVETGLRASAFIFSETRKRVREKDEFVSLDDLKAVKKAALDVNQCFAKYVKQSRGQMDRLLIELHLMRQTIHREATDINANRARAYDMLRQYRQQDATSGNNGSELPPLVAQPHSSVGALSASLAPVSAGSVAVDRAIASTVRLETSILGLSPTGVSHLHGAGILAQLKGRAYTTSSTAAPLPPQP
jgi:hypothetical protein